MDRMFNIQGQCPCCGGNDLDYGVAEFTDDCIYYPWTCEDCGATGTEFYSLNFIEQCNVYDKDGNEIIDW